MERVECVTVHVVASHSSDGAEVADGGEEPYLEGRLRVMPSDVAAIVMLECVSFGVVIVKVLDVEG